MQDNGNLPVTHQEQNSRWRSASNCEYALDAHPVCPQVLEANTASIDVSATACVTPVVWYHYL